MNDREELDGVPDDLLSLYSTNALQRGYERATPDKGQS